MEEVYRLIDGRVYICRGIKKTLYKNNRWTIEEDYWEDGLHVSRTLQIPTYLIDRIDELDGASEKEKEV